ncbi:solute carrier family 25 member 47-B isoform X1 [Thunnus maccoyii]|uniref:solute carrier family 25 member 47-B isoform X1 n=4 Tax=Thunnus maccoyii TaxID=8240 RepID=UPI001C4BB823|nr:solute carrier family 25 member 47-B isoform X1 [Thunnus maccoyii]
MLAAYQLNIRRMDFIAGSAGGAFGVIVGYPFDTVKVNIQSHNMYRGIWHCIHSTYKTEGVCGFYKGMTMPVIAVSLSFSVVFGTYRNVLQRLCKLRHGSPDARPAKCDIFLSGLTGGVAQVLLMSPADMVKVRLQCQRVANSSFSAKALKPKYHGPVHCLRTIAYEEGVLGLYKGAQALALRDGPFFATFLTTYNIICELLSTPGQTQPEWKVVLLAGGLSGMCGWCISTPMDLIKTRLQMDWIGERRYQGFFHCITDSVRSEGPGVFFKGLSLNCMRAIPVNMAVFSVYEITMHLLKHSA